MCITCILSLFYVCYFRNHVLKITDGIDNMGGIRWELLICLIVAWILVFLCLCKGVKSSGKVMIFLLKIKLKLTAFVYLSVSYNRREQLVFLWKQHLLPINRYHFPYSNFKHNNFLSTILLDFKSVVFFLIMKFTFVFLAHLTQRVRWAIPITWRPSSSYVVNFFKNLLLWKY